MKIIILLIFIFVAYAIDGIAEEINDKNYYSFMFILSPLLKEIPQVEDISPDKGDFQNFSFMVSNSDLDENTHKEYDRIVNVSITEKEHIIFNVFFVDDIAMKIEKTELPSLKRTYYERKLPMMNDADGYPADYVDASNAAYRQLIKYGDLLFYLKNGENKIGLKNIVIDEKSSVILIRYYENDYIQSLSINNDHFYNMAIGKHPDGKSPWGELFFSVTMARQNIVAGTLKTDNQSFDCSFFPENGLERYMTGLNGVWSNVIIWNEKGKITKQISYRDWIKTMNKRD